MSKLFGGDNAPTLRDVCEGSKITAEACCMDAKASVRAAACRMARTRRAVLVVRNSAVVGILT